MTAAGFLLWSIAGLAVLAGMFWLGIWVGLGMAEDRRQQADADALERGMLEQRPTLLLEAPARPRMPTGRPNYHPADYIAPGRQLPGYAEYLPRPGLLSIENVPAAVAAASWPPPSAQHVGPHRPITSPVDLEADVLRLCEESELYVAALIARSRHAERNHPW